VGKTVRRENAFVHGFFYVSAGGFSTQSLCLLNGRKGVLTV